MLDALPLGQVDKIPEAAEEVKFVWALHALSCLVWMVYNYQDQSPFPVEILK